MKRIICTFLLAACGMVVAMPAQAQLLAWGFKGGLNMSKLDLDRALSSDNNTGFFIGPMAELTIPMVGVGLDAALMYSQRGRKYNTVAEGREGKIINMDGRQQGVEIPVHLKYTIGLGSMLGIYLAAGSDFFFNFRDIKIDGRKHDVDTKRTQVALNLGAGLKLVRHLQAGFTYQIPVGDSFSLEKAAGKGFNKGKTKTWQVSLAYLF